MRTMLSWLMRLVLLVVVGTVLARVVRGLGASGVVPAIGGDTWAPVPVKPASAQVDVDS